MHLNSVLLRGRLSMEPEHRELPSGVVLTRWRLAIRRPDDHPGYQRADAIECATFEDDVRVIVSDWCLDDIVEVEGAVRRRWWRGGSRYEVEVRTARRVERHPARRARAGSDEVGAAERAGELPGTDDNPAATPPDTLSPAGAGSPPVPPRGAEDDASPGVPPMSAVGPATPQASRPTIAATSTPSVTSIDAEGVPAAETRTESGRPEAGRAESRHAEVEAAAEEGHPMAKRRMTSPVRGLGLNEVDFRGTRSPRAATASASSVASGLSRTAVPDSWHASRTAA